MDELAAWQTSNENFELIDVREPEEYDLGNIGGRPIPVGQIRKHAGSIPKDRPVVIMCRSGKRSQQAILELQTLGFENLYNLEGGILAWKEAFAPDLLVI